MKDNNFLKKRMITIINKSDCCGCWGCENICPRKCISMIEDNEGFRYPVVDVENCIDCGLCEKVCPIKIQICDNFIPKSYVVQNKDGFVLRNSTSGGFYSAISKYVIEQGGVVFGAAFDENMVLKHTYSETYDICSKYQGSKYVQSLIGDSYKQAKKFLEAGRLVVFSGTPCQIAGLYGFLMNRRYENLITVDLVCRGTPSPFVLKKYLEYYASEVGSPVVDYRSRDKYYGYNYSTATITFADKSCKYHKGKESDFMLGLYFNNLISRPSCYDCHFKTLHRLSDITIFDCWNAPAVSQSFTSNGATNVFIHTQRGSGIFEKLKDNFIWSVSDIKSIIMKDGIMIRNNVPENHRRAEFFKDLNILSIKDLEKKYLPKSFILRICYYLKPFFYKIGIFSLYFKLKKRIKNLI